jgi:hypothetical protein
MSRERHASKPDIVCCSAFGAMAALANQQRGRCFFVLFPGMPDCAVYVALGSAAIHSAPPRPPGRPRKPPPWEGGGNRQSTSVWDRIDWADAVERLARVAETGPLTGSAGPSCPLTPAAWCAPVPVPSRRACGVSSRSHLVPFEVSVREQPDRSLSGHSDPLLASQLHYVNPGPPRAAHFRGAFLPRVLRN